MYLRDQHKQRSSISSCDLAMHLPSGKMWNTAVLARLMVPHRIHIVILVKLMTPAHITALALLSYLSLVVLPHEPKLSWQPSKLTALLYVSTFATHFGTQIWMTFISGIVLFFKLPRKLFGMVQRHLFPNYFLLNTILGVVTLWTFILHNNKSACEDASLQKWALCICLVCDVLAMVYIVPDMVKTMERRSAMEEEANSSKSDAKDSLAELKLCPQYAALHKRFRRFHGICAIVNFIAMICNAIHMYHLAWKILSTIT